MAKPFTTVLKSYHSLWKVLIVISYQKKIRLINMFTFLNQSELLGISQIRDDIGNVVSFNYDSRGQLENVNTSWGRGLSGFA